MRRFTLLLIAVAAAIACFTASAEPQSEKGRKEWFREFRQYKHEFMIKELNLSKEQQEKFSRYMTRWISPYISSTGRHAL